LIPIIEGWAQTMKRLSGWDALLLYSEAPNVHTHTLKVAVIDASDFEGDFTFELFREMLRRRLHVLEPLRYQLVDIPLRLHHPMWLQECDVDLDYHLRRLSLSGAGGRRELDEAIGRVASTPLDRGHPLWEFHFVEGMADRRFAVIGKVHHALADGVASANLMARAVDPETVVDDHSSQLRVCDPPSRTALLRAAGRDHLQLLRGLPRLIADSVTGTYRVRRRSRERLHDNDIARNFDAPPSFINHVVSPARTFASATLSLAEVKETSKSLGITINDLVLATAAGALRELTLRYDGRADHPIVASVPTSTDTSPDRISGNALSGMLVSLAVHIADPLERVRLTSVATRIAKENYQLLGPDLIPRWTEYLPPFLAPAAFRRLARQDAQNKLMNVAISNVPGPRKRGLIAGAPMSEIYSVGPLTAGCGMNITVWSYVDQLNVSVLCDDLTVDEPHEVTDAMLRAFREIRNATGYPDTSSSVPSAMALAAATPTQNL
jgi:diacylglycerol O-acyltransferase